jgi:hypothetical protein
LQTGYFLPLVNNNRDIKKQEYLTDFLNLDFDESQASKIEWVEELILL